MRTARRKRSFSQNPRRGVRQHVCDVPLEVIERQVLLEVVARRTARARVVQRVVAVRVQAVDATAESHAAQVARRALEMQRLGVAKHHQLLLLLGARLGGA
eukprot:362795-Chlamydomonas_euryale.AAC.6